MAGSAFASPRSRTFRRAGLGLGLVILTMTALEPRAAEANGQSTHLWITEHALEHLPDGPLKELLTSHRLMLDNGTMFPDGGYPLDDPYAEIAHWEPFSGAYMDWIVAQYDFPYEGAAAEHVAFLLGMNSHGMADETFDSLYMERTILYDGDKDELDTMSDIVMMSLVGKRETPTDWVPYDLFDMLYTDAANYDVDVNQMKTGQSLLRVAVQAVGAGSEDPQRVQDAADRYPWGNSHLLDENVPGAPPCEGEVIARYWQSQWELLHERAVYRPVLQTWPRDGGSGHETDSTSIDSWVSLAVSRGLDTTDFDASRFTITSEEGQSIPFNLRVFYGMDSHVIHLKPTADFQPNTVYYVEMSAGVPTIHADDLAAWSWSFSTGDEAPPPINPAWGDGLDGSDGSDPNAEGGEETSGETAGSGTGETSGNTGEPGADDAAQGGSGGACACSSEPEGSIGFGLLPFALAYGWRRRRQR